MKVCSTCQTEFFKDEIFCPHDGTRLVDTPLEESVETVSDNQTMKMDALSFDSDKLLKQARIRKRAAQKQARQEKASTSTSEMITASDLGKHWFEKDIDSSWEQFSVSEFKEKTLQKEKYFVLVLCGLLILLGLTMVWYSHTYDGNEDTVSQQLRD